MEHEWAEDRVSSYLPVPTEKANFLSFLPLVYHSIHTLKNTSVMSLLCLKPSNGFPLHREKKSELLSMTGKVLPDLVHVPSPASFCTVLPQLILLWPHSPPLVPCTGSAHPHLPLSLLCLHMMALPTLRISVQMWPAQGDLPRPSSMETSQSPSLSYYGSTVLLSSIYT